MSDLYKSLKNNLRIHPLSEPADVVKMIFQRRFCGGHLIKDPDKVIDYLFAEYQETDRRSDVSPYEDIRCGIVRVNLAPLDENKLELLGEIFISSANSHIPDRNGFESDLAELLASFDSFGFAFEREKLEKYLEEYRKAGCPAVSHSEKYKELYAPAYRVVHYSELSKLF